MVRKAIGVITPPPPRIEDLSEMAARLTCWTTWILGSVCMITGSACDARQLDRREHEMLDEDILSSSSTFTGLSGALSSGHWNGQTLSNERILGLDGKVAVLNISFDNELSVSDHSATCYNPDKYNLTRTII